jgi:hypothetical protein
MSNTSVNFTNNNSYVVNTTSYYTSPSTLSPNLWFDFSDASTISESNGDLTNILDKSDSNNNLEPPSLQKPDVIGVGGINSLPCVKYDDNLTMLDSSVDFIGKQVILVIRPTNIFKYSLSVQDLKLANYIGLIGDSSIFSQKGLSYNAFAGQLTVSTSEGNSIYTMSSEAITETMDSVIMIGVSLASTVIASINGKEYTTDITIGGGATMPIDIIGQRNPSSGTRPYLKGYFGEFISLPNTTKSDRELAEGYLAWKWGITLPSEHPYSSSPPIT